MERKEYDHEICCYRAVVRLGLTRLACMKASSKQVWRLPGSSASHRRHQRIADRRQPA